MSQLPPGFVIDTQPQGDPVIARDPYKASAEQRAQQGDQRAAEDQGMQRDQFAFNKQSTNYNNVSKLRDDFQKMPEVKSYRVAVQQLDQAINTGDGPQSDLALTYAFAKAMDPDSVVRESEQGMVTNSQPWFQSVVENTKKQFGMDKAGVYSPQAREAIRQQIVNAVTSRRKLYRNKRDYFGELATRYNFTPDEVVGPDDGWAYLDNFRRYDQRRGQQSANPDTLTPERARQTYDRELQNYRADVADLPPKARQIGEQKFNSDPRINALLRASRGGGQSATQSNDGWGSAKVVK